MPRKPPTFHVSIIFTNFLGTYINFNFAPGPKLVGKSPPVTKQRKTNQSASSQPETKVQRPETIYPSGTILANPSGLVEFAYISVLFL